MALKMYMKNQGGPLGGLGGLGGMAAAGALGGGGKQSGGSGLFDLAKKFF